MSKPFVQTLKDYLVRLGPNNALVQMSLRMHGLRHGYSIGFTKDAITLRKANQEMVLSKAQYVLVPMMMELFDLYFKTVEGQSKDGRTVLDFSKPSLHRYRKSGTAFYFPSVPEDDAMDAYTHGYVLKPGDVVWDAGAHAGATAISWRKW